MTEQQPDIPRTAWSVEDAAKTLSVSVSFIRKAMYGTDPSLPVLPTIRLGRRVLILDSDLRAWMEKANDSHSG